MSTSSDSQGPQDPHQVTNLGCFKAAIPIKIEGQEGQGWASLGSGF